MVSAWNIAMGWVNLADVATITASGSITLAPPSRLQNKHVMRKWRVNSNTAFILCDLGSAQGFNTVALIGMSGSNPTLQVRASSADSSGLAGDGYNSGSLGGAWDPNYLPFVRRFTLAAPSRYVRIDILEAGVTFIEAGRLFVGTTTQFALNFQPGWSRAWNDPSVRTIGRSGQTFDDIRDKYRSVSLTVDWVTESDRWNIIEPIDVALGQHGDMLVMVDPSSMNLSRDSIWGYLESGDAVVQPVPFGDQRFRKTYNLRERL